MKNYSFRNFNLADWFSFYRIAAAPLLLFLIWMDARQTFAWFLLISYLTDAIDGQIARAFKITSARGSQLDSIGDQITFTIGLLGALVFEFDFVKTNVWWIVIGFAPYLLQMLIAFLKYGKATAFHTWLAKSSAVIQATFILYLLFFQPVQWLFFAMIAIGILETIEEVILIFILKEWRSDVKGIYVIWRERNQTKRLENKKSINNYA